MAQFTHAFVLSALLALAGAAVLAAAGDAPDPENADRIAPGQAAPDFTLPASGGTSHHLAEARAQTNLVLVFFRGAW